MDRALAETSIDRTKTYVTNAVKHFKWEGLGKRRIHMPPSKYEIGACRPWLESELLVVRPKLVVAMGSTAARSLLDRDVKFLQERGRVLPGINGYPIAVTVHPSSILRSRDDSSRHQAMAEFVDDLRAACNHIAAAL